MGRTIMISLAFACVCTAKAVACTCVSFPTTGEAMNSSALVFRGSVVDVERLAEHPLMRGRQRYAYTFRVAEYWRGSPTRTIRLYALDASMDCMGTRFDSGKEYLVFGSEEKAKDYQPDPNFYWYGWTDVLAPGTPMFQPITACVPGGNTSASEVRKQLRQLGRGLVPKH